MAGVTFTFLVGIIAIVNIDLMNINGQITIGPGDLTRTEGDRNEFIPCPFDGDITPFWRINNTFYHFTTLPCPFVASTSPVGLVITLVDMSLSGTSFQCFAPGTGIDTSLMASSIGVLTVVSNPLYGGDGVDMNSTKLSIQLITQQLWFGVDNALLGWSRFDNDKIVEDNTSLRYILSASNCDISGNTSVVDNTTNTSTVLPLDGKYVNTYFNITAFDEAGDQTSTINELFRINSDVVTKNITQMIGSTCPVCVNIPQPLNAPFFNIPRTVSNKGDILCKAVGTPEEEMGPSRCLNLTSTCVGFSQTSFSTSLTICRLSTDSSITDYHMCFSNITRDMNSTKIHFFYSSSPQCTITGKRVTSRLYIDSYEIIAQDSMGSIDVTVNASIGELCLTSLPRTCFSTTVYNITVSDVTGYAAYTRMDIQDRECTQIAALQSLDSECAPFEIAIDAYNPLVTYQTVYRTVGEEYSTSPCSCAQQRAHVNLSEVTSVLSQIEFSCSTTASTDYGIKFFIIAIDEATNITVFTSELQMCTNIKTVEITNIPCNRNYLVSAHLAFPNGSLTMCTLSNTVGIISKECPTSDAPTEGPTNNPILAIITIPLVLIVIAIVVTVVVIAAILVWRKKGTGNYRPRRAERERGVNLQKKNDSNKEQPVGNQLRQEHDLATEI